MSVRWDSFERSVGESAGFTRKRPLVRVQYRSPELRMTFTLVFSLQGRSVQAIEDIQ